MSTTEARPIKRRIWDAAGAIQALEGELYGADYADLGPTEREARRRDLAERWSRQHEHVEAEPALAESSLRSELRKSEILSTIVARFERAGEREQDTTLRRLHQIAEKGLGTSAELMVEFASIAAALQQHVDLQHETFARDTDHRHDVVCEPVGRIGPTLQALVSDLALLAERLPELLPTPEEEQREERRRAVAALRLLGCTQSHIARLIDPAGYREDRYRATERIRKEEDAIRHEQPEWFENGDPKDALTPRGHPSVTAIGIRRQDDINNFPSVRVRRDPRDPKRFVVMAFPSAPPTPDPPDAENGRNGAATGSGRKTE